MSSPALSASDRERFAELAKSEKDPVKRAHLRRMARPEDIIPLTFRDETEKRKRQETIRQIDAIGKKNRLEAQRIAAEDVARSDAHHASVMVEQAVRADREAKDAAANAEAAPLPGDITDIKGLGYVAAELLAEHGVHTVSDLATMSEAKVQAFRSNLKTTRFGEKVYDWIRQAAAMT